MNAFLDLLFPPRCAVCTRVDYLLCPRCLASLPPPSTFNRAAPSPLHAVTATGYHVDALRALVKTMKYASDLKTARHLTVILAKRLHNALTLTGWQVDLLVAVPLHNSRQHKRGFNQAALLASALADQTGLLYAPSALQRTRATRSQVGLDMHQRRLNMYGAFQAESSLVAGRHIVLIDDVFTTGATLAASAEALMNAGAHSVYGLTVTTAPLTP